MKILGLQKLSLIDYPGKAAATLFLFGCNFRCGFCHNPELVVGFEGAHPPLPLCDLADNDNPNLQFAIDEEAIKSAHPNLAHSVRSSHPLRVLADNDKQLSDEESANQNDKALLNSYSIKISEPEARQNEQSSLREYSEDEILDFLEKRRKYLDGVCVTGGEPLMSVEKDFLRKIKDLGYKIKIDTNGSFPEKLRNFIDKGLVDFVSMDVKVGRERYSEVAGVDVDLEKIEESVRLVASLPNHEFRTTVVKKFHDVHEMKALVSWIGGIVGGKIKKFVLQGFRAREKMLDESFKQEEDVDEEYLEGLKKVCEGFVGEVLVRV